MLELLPDDSLLFRRADRDLLAHLLGESIQYVDHPGFHQPGAEKRLFGARALLADSQTHFVEAPSSRGNPRARLDSTEEALLFQQFNYTRMRCQRALRRLRCRCKPTDTLRLLLAWAHREMELRGRIVEANMPLVLGMLGRARVTGLDFSELVSEGNMALLRCVDKFNCSMGFKFSTYACRAILKSFARVGIATRRHREHFPVVLDPAMGPDDRSEQRHDEAESMCVLEVRKILAENRAALSALEHKILRARFTPVQDLRDSRPQTLEQLGRLIGVSKERVRQIQNKALRKLRSALEDSLVKTLI